MAGASVSGADSAPLFSPLAERDELEELLEEASAPGAGSVVGMGLASEPASETALDADAAGLAP